MSNREVLEQAVCLHIQCSMWAGQRRLGPEDLGLVTDQLPPESMLSLGSLKQCNPKRLLPLKAITKGAYRDCSRWAVRFLGGYALDESNLDGLMSQLAIRKSEFDKQARGFVTALELELEEWIAANSTWAEALRRKPPDVSRVANSFVFEYHAFRLRAATDDADSEEKYGLVTAVSRLSERLFRDIEQEAQTTYKDSYAGKEAVGQKALWPIKRIRERLDSLRFIDARIRPVIDHIDAVLGPLPTRGTLAGKDYMAVTSLLKILCDADQMVRHSVSASESAAADADVPHDRQRRTQPGASSDTLIF